MQQPKFSLKLFVSGLLPFFTGVVLAFLSNQGALELMDIAWGLMVLGVIIALPGYIGIWRWRWIKFKND